VVILQWFAGGYNPDEDFKEKCQDFATGDR
jgi:hypothetical protein